VIIGFFKSRRRKRLRSAPIPSAWLDIIDRNVPIYRRLIEADRHELLGHTQVFLAEKYFEGCGGLVLTDEIKVTIAAQACILLLRRDTDYYPRLVTILVYPHAYSANTVESIGAGVVQERVDIRLGEAWKSGVVVLSWDDVQAQARNISEGQNLVLHEFAHQLDMEDGAADGTPLLSRRSQHTAWATVMSREYERLQRDSFLGRGTVLDKYGASDPAEFFAVATECFFVTPGPLKRKHPELYKELKVFYKQDPINFTSNGP
jgi:Mlc titration factor MtfA (ptsG expression regulator)